MAASPYLTPEELAAELEAGKCRFIKKGANDYQFWESPTGEPFTVPPPEELMAGEHRYPAWFLEDRIKELDLPPKSVD